MGCHSHGPISAAWLSGTSAWDTDTLEMFVLVELDLRPSEIPDYADRSWFRQRLIDHHAVLAGELEEMPPT